MIRKLEHRKQKVLPFSKFLLRLAGFGLFSFLLIVFSAGIGTLGYYHFGLLNWLDSFYMSCMILTGMGPVIEMKTEAAKIFSSFYALYSGVAFLSVIAIFFAPIVHRLLHILHVEEPEENNR